MHNLHNLPAQNTWLL